MLSRIVAVTMMLFLVGCCNDEAERITTHSSQNAHAKQAERESKLDKDENYAVTTRKAVEKLLTRGRDGREILTRIIENSLDNRDIETPKKIIEILFEPQTANADTRKYFIEKLLAHGSGGKSIVEKLIIGKDMKWLHDFLGEMGPVWTLVDTSAKPPQKPRGYDEGPFVLFYGKIAFWTDKKTIIDISYDSVPEKYRPKGKSSEAKEQQSDTRK